MSIQASTSPSIQTSDNKGAWVKSMARSIGHSLITWEWTKRLLYWLIISAGTMSELAFLVASLWISVNSSVHTFVLLFMPVNVNENVTYLATTAYVALPELVLGLAFVTVIGHVKMFLYSRRAGQKNYIALVWATLFGLPTLVFLVLSVFTLGSAVSSINFVVPTPLLVIRAIAGYMFAFSSLLYTQLGNPQEAERLTVKDRVIASLREEHARVIATLTKAKDDLLAKVTSEKDALIASLQQEKNQIAHTLTSDKTTAISSLQREKDEMIAFLKGENQKLNGIIEEKNMLLAQSRSVQAKLLETVNKSSEDALQAYSQDCQNWLNSGVKSVLVDDVVRFTGHSKRKLNNLITKKVLHTSGRNGELILVSSLVEWLKQNPPPTKEEYEKDRETEPKLHIVGTVAAN